MSAVPFVPKKINVADVNGGNRYNEGVISVEDYNKTIEGIMQSNADSESALTKATTAETKATSANGKSDAAVTTANSADGKATAAVNAATAANAKSDTALTTANAAKAEASASKTQSAAAETKATTAVDKSNQNIVDLKALQATYETKIDGKVETITTTANNAKTNAMSANTKSDTAVATANAASATANGIDGKATEALTKSNSAVAKADKNIVDLKAMQTTYETKIDGKIVTINTTANDAKAIAADALSQVVQGQGTKVTVGGVAQATWNADQKADTTAIPTKTSQLTNDSNFDTVANVNSKLSGKADTTAMNTGLAEKQAKNVVVTNLSIHTSAWAMDSPFEYRACFYVEAARAAYSPNVFFSNQSSALKILYPFASCTDHYVNIFANEIPTTAVTIDKIVFVV